MLSKLYPRETEKLPVLNHSNELYKCKYLSETVWNKKIIELIKVKPINDNAGKWDLYLILLPNNIKIRNDNIGKNKNDINLISI